MARLQSTNTTAKHETVKRETVSTNQRADLPPLPDRNAQNGRDQNGPSPVQNAPARSPRPVENLADHDLPPLSTLVDTGEPYFSFESLPPFPHPIHHPLRAIGWIVQLLFGVASVIFFLAVLAAIPIVNFLALGYLLDAQGRVARTGKLTYAMPLLPLAPRFGGIALGIWLWLFPVRFMAGIARDAAILDPGGSVARNWQVIHFLTSSLIAAHLILALSRGGGFSCFFRPIKNLRWMISQFRSDSYWKTAHAAIRDFLIALQIPQNFWLGIRGFFGTFLWLVVPSIIYSALQDIKNPAQVIITLIGGVMLAVVLSWVPFLQARFSAEGRLSVMRDVRRVREMYRRAPVVMLLSVIVLYALSLPLYLFKIAPFPPDARWFATLIFVATIYPAKILIGWAYSWAVHRQRRRWLILRWPCGLIYWGLISAYLFIVFFTPAISARGRTVLIEHHALLLPSPF